MTQHRITTLDLSPYYRHSIGMDSFVDRLMNQIHGGANNGNYPPYNVVQIDKSNYRIEVAIAGFAEDEISVTVENNQLTVSGSHKETDPEVLNGEEEIVTEQYLFQGISARDFVRTWALADHVEVQNAVVENGILRISLVRIVPDSLKPKQIPVTFKS